MKGTIKVSQMLSMTASANVEGQVFTEKLSVEPGANLNGTVSMGAVMRSIEDKKEGDKSAKTA
jgi:cytoskeletal protein CcmA (bactofilin family)